MPLTAVVTSEVDAFWKAYADGVARLDAAFLVAQYRYPTHVTSDSGKVAVYVLANQSEWRRKLEDLFFSYRRMGVSSVATLAIKNEALSPLLVRSHVHWALKDAEEKLLYDYETTYTLGRFDNRFLITNSVVHNEIPHYRAETLAGGFAPRSLKL